MTTAFSLVLAGDYERRALALKEELDYVKWSIAHVAEYKYTPQQIDKWRLQLPKLQKEVDANFAEASRLRGSLT